MDKLEQLASDPRITIRSGSSPNTEGDCVVYWMQRAQRALDNPALDTAVEAGNALGKPTVVFFAPVPFYPHANLRHYRFLSDGITDIAEALEKRDIGFVLRRFPDHSLIKFCDEVNPCLVIGDENPLRETEQWRQAATRKLKGPLWTVDADVVVPTKLLEKAQYAAHIIRPRLKRHLKQFLIQSSNTKANVSWKPKQKLHSLPLNTDITEGWNIDRTVDPVHEFRGGTREALRRLHEFTSRKLKHYSKQRNHPEIDGTSDLSAYLHFGNISPITVALAVKAAAAPRDDKDRFLDQLITWRELSINMVRFNPNYDNFENGEAWAHRTLAEHIKDERPVLYTPKQMENAETYDPLWNAAQMQMINSGWMHNYMRMYWAKKILEWSRTPAEAYRTTVALNDKYFMDGRDPNGYAGIAWAIVGKFDRPWFDRPIFGTIRYMSLASTGKKFDSKKYIEQQTQPRMF
jgi:deoxyribodipyrimidine photo-lyase